jgi:metal-responsive CopG/Arc/MetJ family transcriptional regulator
MGMTEVITLSMDPRLRKRLDKIRGNVTRSKFIALILQRELEKTGRSINVENTKKIRGVLPEE